MKKATFSEGIVIALIISVAVAAIFTLFHKFYFDGGILKFIIVGVAFPYIVYLLMKSKQRIGRVSVMFIWLVITVTSFIFISSLMFFIVSQIFVVWIVRSLYFYNSVFSALADLFLSAMSLIVAIWAWSSTGSMLLTFWCFFLMQALFVFIPKNIFKISKSKMVGFDSPLEEPFDVAYHSAQQAITKIVNHK